MNIHRTNLRPNARRRCLPTIVAALATAFAAACSSSPAAPGDTDATDGTDTDTETGPAWALAAVAACPPPAAEAAPVPDTAPAAGRRADVFYPYERYPEDKIPDPTGGRVQVALIAAAEGDVTAVEIDGIDVTAMALPAEATSPVPAAVTTLIETHRFDWVHVQPFRAVTGAPMFVNFHARGGAAVGGDSVRIIVRTATGTAVDATVPLAPAPVPLTYVTTTADFTRVLVYLRNTDAAPHTIAGITVNGRDETARACIPYRTLAPGASIMIALPARDLGLGRVLNVIVRFTDAPPAVGTGRVTAEHYPIHTWPVEDECPLPGANVAGYAAHRARAFDTFFTRSLYDKPICGGATAAAIATAALAEPDAYLLFDEWAPAPAEGDRRRFARLLGDEVDDDKPAKPWIVSQDAKRSWRSDPQLTTYIGGARHRRTGRFAGVSDVQGFDIYFAACAPSILVVTNPPLRAPYDYFRAVAANHAPGPTWFYAQGLHGGWQGRQPDPTELDVAVMSVVAAAGKGLMYFQTDLALATRFSATWDQMGRVNRVVRAVRTLLREGDETGGAAASEPEVLTAAIRGPDAIVVPVVNVTAEQTVTFRDCYVTEDPHWRLAAVAPDVTVRVPDDFAVADVFEVTPAGTADVAETIGAAGRDLTFTAVGMEQARPYRLFVLARSADLRARVQTAGGF